MALALPLLVSILVASQSGQAPSTLNEAQDTAWKKLVYALTNYAGTEVKFDQRTLKSIDRDTYKLETDDKKDRITEVTFAWSRKTWYTSKGTSQDGLDEFFEGEVLIKSPLVWSNIDLVEIRPTDPDSKTPAPNILRMHVKEKVKLSAKFNDNLGSRENLRKGLEDQAKTFDGVSSDYIAIIFDKPERLKKTATALIGWFDSIGLKPKVENVDPSGNAPKNLH